MFVERLQENVRSHLLLMGDLKRPDFDKAAKTVEDYYRNVYIDNEFTAGTNVFKGNYNKGKSEGKYGKKGQDRYTNFTG
eukprot:350917-Amphidinium_carterae.1